MYGDSSIRIKKKLVIHGTCRKSESHHEQT